MSIAKLSNIAKVFGGREPSEEERRGAYREALLMTLSRASSSDANVSPVEVETVRQVVARVTGEDVSAADVRTAAASELYERAPLDRYLSSVARTLRSEERSAIVRSLSEVIQSDVRVSPREIEFFNRVADALKATPSEIAGLIEEA